jgi:hypothetical protein
MKFLKSLGAVTCAFAILAGTAMADDKPADKQSCCDKAKAAGKACTHKCCVEAKKNGKVCEKCNPGKSKKDDKKDKA